MVVWLPVRLKHALLNLVEAGPLVREASQTRNLKVLRNLLGPAFRGLILQRGKEEDVTVMGTRAPASFCWSYERALRV